MRPGAFEKNHVQVFALNGHPINVRGAVLMRLIYWPGYVSKEARDSKKKAWGYLHYSCQILQSDINFKEYPTQNKTAVWGSYILQWIPTLDPYSSLPDRPWKGKWKAPPEKHLVQTNIDEGGRPGGSWNLEAPFNKKGAPRFQPPSPSCEWVCGTYCSTNTLHNQCNQ